MAVLAVVLVWLAPVAPATASTSPVPARLTALRWAEAQAGKWYCWGGSAGCFDCSGLAMAAYAHAGISLPHSTYSMLASRHLVREPLSQARRGDLIFYGPGHVELKTRPSNGTFGALEQGTRIGWHRWSGWWVPTMAFRVR